MSKTVRIVGVGLTQLGRLGRSATQLQAAALEAALGDARLDLEDVGGLIAVPSLSEPRFMQAHYLATELGLLPHRNKLMRTIDTGGAGPITALLDAAEMIMGDQADVVAVVAGDAVSSLPTHAFLERADRGCSPPDGSLKSPVIPRGYDRVAQWQMATYGTTREQLAMCSVFASHQASRHPLALTRRVHTLSEVLGSPEIAPATTLLECARRADGGGAVILASSRWLERHGYDSRHPVLLGGGEASGPLYPPPVIDETVFSCEAAAKFAHESAQVSPDEIDWWGLYDCFPVCFVRALEAVGLAPKGGGGDWVEQRYREIVDLNGGSDDVIPVNTHGGLLAFGAPWETPAIFNVIEGVQQLRGNAEGRQVDGARRALCYGNGGIFSASAVAILGQGYWHG